MRICVLDDWEQAAEHLVDWSPIRERAELVIRSERFGTEAALVEGLRDFDAIVVMRERTRFPREVIERLPDLRLIVTTAVRNAAIDLHACADHSITVCHTTGGGMPVVEHAWALILSALKGIPTADASMKRGGWEPRLGVELAGKRLGLLGLGRTGARMSLIARAFGMDVLAWSPNLTQERADECGAELVTKEQLFAESDIVSVHLVLSKRSRGLVGADELALMRPTSWLVNTSRGPIVDEQALIDACREGRIAGAMLDVYDEEPLPSDHPLRTTPRLLLTPHTGYVVDASMRVWFEDVIEDLLAYADGQPIRVLSPA